MFKLPLRMFGALALSLLIIATPVLMQAQPEPAQPGPPPIAPPLVREGDFAVQLEFALGVGVSDDEVEAESRLAEIGILPKNGWIADYPMTPDVIGELQQAVSDAVRAGKLSLSQEEALNRFEKTLHESGLTVKPYGAGDISGAPPPAMESYPNPAVVNNYYYREGPPVVTCYTPPHDFYHMYAWVPYPFWWTGFWFPGFFILHDFHRTVIIQKRVVFVSNHFRDVRANRVFRIDPVSRFHGRTFGGIGASRTRGLLPTGIPGSERRIFNRPRGVPGGIMVDPPFSRGGRTPRPPSRVTPPSRGGAVVTPPSRRGGDGATPSSRGGGSSRQPSSSGRGSSGGGQRR